MGDPAGIGIEITLRAWHARHARSLPAFAFYADPDAVADQCGALGLPTPTVIVSTPEEAHRAFATALPLLPVRVAAPVTSGRPDAANAPAVIGAIETAVADARGGRVAGIVTNPIAKSVLKQAGFPHPGHTELLGALSARLWPDHESHAVMMLAAPELRVVPLTVHIPLADVPRAITTELLERTTRTLWRALRDDFGLAHPRIVVAGLNPHAGENGTMGLEEQQLIAPGIARLAAEGLDVTGPYPADTLFYAARRARYDAALCMYHDQALIPLKTLAFDTGVNVTLGLAFVRTSPDHGTAFDIAGRGIASPESLIASIELAARIAAQRARGAR